jgi:carbonic anhydrase
MSTPLPQANAAYAAGFGDKGALALPPAKKAAFLVCMDARIEPAAAFGLAEGDVHVIRNAGGRASDDAIRSLVISHKLLGTAEFFIVHHTDCGMQYFTDSTMAELLATSVATANIVVKDGVVGFKNATSEGGAPDGRFINWLTIKDQAQSIRDDAARIRGSPLVNKAIPIHGYVYDVKSGRLDHVLSV